MKKRGLTAIIVAVLILAMAMPVQAVPPDFSGGVADEYKYQEMVFLTGEPVLFSGTIKINQKEKGDIRTITYDMSLTSDNKALKGKLSRKMSYVISSDRQVEVGQTLSQTEVTSFKESITINGDKYDLKDMQFSKSDAVDNRPASDFYSGNIQARKTYTINKTQGELILDISGGDVGYNNFWGSTETQILDYSIRVARTIPPAKGQTQSRDVSWDGTVRVGVSDSINSSLQYSESLASLSSFNGSYTRVTRGEMAAQYDYDLPLMMDGFVTNDRNRGQTSLNLQKLPKVEKLLIPKFRDIGGHWAEESIKQLYSLDVFTGSSQFFAPDAPISRIDFIRALIKACDIRTNQESGVGKKKAPPEVSPFSDLPVSSPDYKYVKAAIEKGLTTGVSVSKFGPDNELSRAQAITMLIKALGYEGKAPSPGYSTAFADEDQIPSWSRDSIYLAAEIGLISGDESNNIYPAKAITRGEASSMLTRFLEFLQSDLQKDYRENIVLFN